MLTTTKPSRPLLFLLAFLWYGTTATAQTVAVDVRVSRDDIPATIVRTNLGINGLDLAPFTFGAGFGLLFGEQLEQGARARVRLWNHQSEVTALVRLSDAISLEAAAGATVLGGEAVLGTWRGVARIAGSIDAGDTTRQLGWRIALDAARRPELSVLTAIEERIMMTSGGGELELKLAKVATAALRYEHQEMSDDNARQSGYAYALWHVLEQPAVSIGYSYSFADSERDNWQATSWSYDPKTRLYSFDYAYAPYFTPLDERGHSLIAVVSASPAEHLYLYAKGVVPFASTGLLGGGPATAPRLPEGGLPQHVADNVLPVQFELAIATDALAPAVVRLDGAWFSKPYYSSFSGGLRIEYRF